MISPLSVIVALLLLQRTAGFGSIPKAFKRLVRATATSSNLHMLKDRYFDRLGFSKEEAEALATRPTKANLDRIVEAHLATITFDNLSQHGLPFTASVDANKNARKVLDEKRGGFCFELNGLLGELLLELGYAVKRVPAIVHSSENEFRGRATHIILIVTVEGERYYVDVGFGEPPIHPLKIELDAIQETPEGTISRLIKCPDDDEAVVLQWKQGEDWSPRLKWNSDHPGQELPAFHEGLEVVLGEESIFAEKLIVCKINRKEKVSLAGNRLKITSPRFGPDSQATVEELGSLKEVQRVLEERFGVPSAQGLGMGRSKKADPAMWAWM